MRDWILPLWVFCLLSGLANGQVNRHWERHTIDASSRGADGVRLLDFNHDGRLDLVTGWEEGRSVRVYLQPDSKTIREPWETLEVGQVGSPEDAVMVDLNQDGVVEVVSSCEGRTRTMYLHHLQEGFDRTRVRQPADWETVPIAATAGRMQWMFCVPLNVDNRRGIDLVVGGKGEGAEIGWLAAPDNPLDGAQWNYSAFQSCGWIMSLRSVDMDGDGDLDLLYSDRRGAEKGVYWLECPHQHVEHSSDRDGDRQSDRQSGQELRIDWQRHLVGGESEEVMFLDYWPKTEPPLMIHVATRNGFSLLLSRHDSRQLQWHRRELANPNGVRHGKAVGLGDLNGDDVPDLVESFNTSVERTNMGKPGVTYRLGMLDATGDLSFANPQPIDDGTGLKFDRIEMMDVDHDGDLDVITCEERANLGVIWYENEIVERLAIR